MEDPTDSERALALVQGAELPHPDGELLACFVQNSIDQDRAGRHLLSVCEQGWGDDSGLHTFLTRWKSLVQLCEFYLGVPYMVSDICLVAERRPCSAIYDKHIVRDIRARDGVCYLTGKQGSWLDPLVVAPIFPSMGTSLDIVSPVPHPRNVRLLFFQDLTNHVILSRTKRCLLPILVRRIWSGCVRIHLTLKVYRNRTVISGLSGNQLRTLLHGAFLRSDSRVTV
jgi:hypothetical protein